MSRLSAAAAHNRLAMAMKKMAPGTMGGQSRVANLPGPNWSQLTTSEPPTPVATDFCIDIVPNQLVAVDSIHYPYPGNSANALAFDLSTLVGTIVPPISFDGDKTFGFETGPYPDFTYMIVSAQATLTTDVNPVDCGFQAFVELTQGATFNPTAAWAGPNGNDDIPEDYVISTDDSYPLVDWYTDPTGVPLDLQLTVHPFAREVSFTDEFYNVVSGTLCVQWRIGE